jgi:hypothetical protein
VNKGYGYRMFLDDMPSATVVDGQTHYEWTVPLGFIPDKKNLEKFLSDKKFMDGRGFIPVAIYNHLDIKIKVHPTLKSDLFGFANNTIQT